MSTPMTRRDLLLAGSAAAGVLLAPRAIRARDEDLTLVLQGRSDYVIVRPHEASPSQAYAAEELQRFAREITGATLPIATDQAPLPSQAILLGVTRHTAAVLGPLPEKDRLGTDGFLLRSRGPHLCIVGSAVRGVLYGVYELLEKWGGCRWYASFHSVIPRRSTWRIPPLDEIQVPAFAMREPFWFDMFEGDFAARCKVNGNRMALEERHGGKVRFGADMFVHTFYRLLPPAEFFNDHPEYFSEINGRRTAEHAQLCLANDNVLRIVAERLLAAIRKDPGGKLFSVSQNDWHGFCTCSRCRAVDEEEGSHAGTMIRFVNQVAEAVEKEFPDVWVETLAYQYTRKPPRLARPRHNVVPRLCTIECDFSKPLDASPYEQNRSFVQDIRGWSAITDKLYVWDYTTNFHNYIGPFPNFAALQPNVRLFRDNRVVGLFEQGAYESRHAEFAELRAWVLAKLLWNPDLPMERLYEDFFPGYYGAAAEPVRAYFDELHALVKDPEVTLRIFDSMRAAWLTDAFLERAAGLWAEAERRVKEDPSALFRVRMGGIPVWHARYRRMPDPAPRYALRGELLEPAGVPQEYRRVAGELLRRVDEGQVQLREYARYHNMELALLRGRATGHPLATLREGKLSVGVAPGMGGCVVRLGTDREENLLDPDAGGLDGVDRHWRLLAPDPDPFELVRTAQGAVALRRTVGGRHDIERSVRLEKGTLRFAQRFASNSLAEHTVWPALRAAFRLPNAGAVILRAGAEEQVCTVPPDQTRASFTVPAGALAAREWVVAPAAGGSAVRLHWPEVAFERVILHVDAVAGTLRVLAAAPSQRLGVGGSCDLALGIEPTRTEAAAKALTPNVHRPDRVVIEEWELTLGRPGEWAEIAADPEAQNGYALKLHGNNFEWNATWPVEPERLQPGARYQARVRLKVEQAGRQGEAFWSGIYDAIRKQSRGDIARRTDQVDAGYQWHDLGVWTPESGQYLWTGPGRFARDGGRSAIAAVSVDCYELRIAGQEGR